MSAAFTYTSDFQHQFQAETDALLRRRFLRLTLMLAILALILVVIGIVILVTRAPDAPTMGPWRALAINTLNLVVALVFFHHGRRKGLSRTTYLDMTMWLVIVGGLLHVFARALSGGDGVGLLAVMGTHILACMFLPWTPFQSIKPIVPILVVSGLMRLLVERSGGLTDEILGISVSPLIATPGILICLLRHTRRVENFKIRFLQSRYGELRRELVDARRIHEDLFPAFITDGPVRMTYLYEPMRHIGGDYLYARHVLSPDGRATSLNVLLLDVTGHGIAAALTVNRLYGEVERLFAENPGILPGEVLKSLNRYVNLTLAAHSVFATALCIRIDPQSDQIHYASGGHPPAFLRAIDGTLERLDSTAFVLGLCDDASFDPAPRTLKFVAGDVLIAYTDGACEALNDSGRMLGIAGLERLMACGAPSPEGGWARSVLEHVDAHRKGPPEDDTLVVEVRRDILEMGAPRSDGVAARAPAHVAVGAPA